MIMERFLSAAVAIDEFPSVADVEIAEFVLRKEMRQYDGIVEVSLGEEPSSNENAPLTAQMTSQIGGQPTTFSLYENTSKKVTRRAPSADEERFVQSLQQTRPFAGRCILVNLSSNTDLIRSIVEANKQIHIRSLDGDNPNIRWVYLKGFRLPSDVPAEPRIPAIFRHMATATLKGVRCTRTGFTLRIGEKDHTGEIRFTYDLVPSHRAVHRSEHSFLQDTRM